MILEGFEIENWSCIKKVRVAGLPSTGVVVICGPNRRGKSSIVQALRACLMDYPATTSALKNWYPRGTGEKPTVAVNFLAAGRSYRIRKQFGTSKSEFATRTVAGEWKVETSSAADAHLRACALVGGDDSTKGLHQLLWLTQADFRLPEAKKFDASVQARLRAILGVLQTPLDDRFIQSVKERWSTWYSGQRKAGKQQQIKDACTLAKNLRTLDEAHQELEASDRRFVEVESLLRQAGDWERSIAALSQELARQRNELTQLQDEHQRSQTRIEARQQAEKDDAATGKAHQAALDEQTRRAQAAQRLVDDEQAVSPAREKSESARQRVNDLEKQQTEHQGKIAAERDNRRNLQARASQVAAKLLALDNADKLHSAQEVLKRVQAIAMEMEGIEQFLRDYPAPDARQLNALKENRLLAARLQADCEAASMSLKITPEHEASAAQIQVDGGESVELAGHAAMNHAVRRKAELRIGGFGTIELARGMAQRDMDQIEGDLQCCHEEFADAVAAFGVAAAEADALDQLIRRDAERKIKRANLESKKKELGALAPDGLQPLAARVRQLEATLKNAPSEPPDAIPLPANRDGLAQESANLQHQIATVDQVILRLEDQAAAIVNKLAFAQQDERNARERFLVLETTARSKREELERLPSEQEIARRVAEAQHAAECAKARFAQTELTREEQTINERLKAAQVAVAALERQSGENTRKLDVIKGRLLESEGLHSRRAALAARVDELVRLTDSESLEKDAIDRLYALFEECREKQLGALLTPIHDRVLTWMRVLDIGEYKEVRFNDAFLPDTLTSRGGTAEFSLSEESTGAQEQIGMLVRLALGSVLSSASDPAGAILDDPLTHCDVGRLSRMRGILRRAAEGDPSLTPPAGPLQILIFTCHPEWFRDEKTTVIDLEDEAIMSRLAV